MTKVKGNTKKALALFLSIVMIVIMIPTTAIPIFGLVGDAYTRVVDDDTSGGWKTFFAEDSSENAGAIWTDKSVFANDSYTFYNSNNNMTTTIYRRYANSFLVALSAMGSTSTITGQTAVPTDTILILDVSGSMNKNNNGAADELVDAANESIQTLLEDNPQNRVGVVLYSGSSGWDDNYTRAAQTLLPLGRYKYGERQSVNVGTYSNPEYVYKNKYLTYTDTSDGEVISIHADTTIEGTNQVPQGDISSRYVTGATYIQGGVIQAKDEFLKVTDTTAQDPIMGTVERIPIVVLMSDGAPTLGSLNYTNPGFNETRGYNMGDGSVTSNRLGFVTQLSAAYAKYEIEKHYDNKCMFYTLGLGTSGNDVATSVLNPDNSNATIDIYWSYYNNTGNGKEFNIGTRNNPVYVIKHTLPEGEVLSQSYVTQNFSANQASDLTEVFKQIMGEIEKETASYPTLVKDSEHLSGYVSFVDKIGEYMHVAAVKGILMHGTLFSGSDVASYFVEGDRRMIDANGNPTALGTQLFSSIQTRLGLPTMNDARTLIYQAYTHGQLSYSSESNYSNYIGWYADEDDQYIAPWYDGATQPDNAVSIVKSYLYIGEVDNTHGIDASDMMYTTVRVKENITTGEQTVAFAIPATLLPLVQYHITLNKANGTPISMVKEGAGAPIRLLYEVALDKNVNEFTINDANIVDASYIDSNKNDDGSVNFYTNQWDRELKTGYNTVNTYDYFNPSKQNQQYYYTQDTDVLVKSGSNYVKYTGSKPETTGEFYREFVFYTNSANGTQKSSTYYPLSAGTLGVVKGDDSGWYVPAGTVRSTISELDIVSSSNTGDATKTLPFVAQTFVDVSRHQVDDSGYYFYVGDTLGNNGKLTILPQTGIKLAKNVQGVIESGYGVFKFEIIGPSSGDVKALFVDADGNQVKTAVEFVDNKATVWLKNGETMYIGGLTVGQEYLVREIQTVGSKVLSITGGTVNVAEGTTIVTPIATDMIAVEFVNAPRGTGDFTLTKQVEHDQGNTSTGNPAFKMIVSLSGVGTVDKDFRVSHTGNSALRWITTDSNGQFTVHLKHNETFTIEDLPEGTGVSVVEEHVDGFNETYWDNGVVGDGKVSIEANNVSSVLVINNHQPTEVYPVNITVNGQKDFTGRDNNQWLPTDSFTFQLQKYGGVNATTGEAIWTPLGDDVNAHTVTVSGTDADKSFTFTNVFQNERYTVAGTYYYRIVEVVPDTPIAGVTYDRTIHSFAVRVSDSDLDGELQIDEVIPTRASTTVNQSNGQNGNTWAVTTNFANAYAARATNAYIEINKHVNDLSGNLNTTLEGFTFEIYEENGTTLIATSKPTSVAGTTRVELPIFTVAGTYKYVVKEVNEGKVGWTYDASSQMVIVEVADDGQGNLVAKAYTGTDSTGADDVANITFTNTYQPASDILPIDFVSKILEGKNLAEKEFQFEVKPVTVDADDKLVEGNAILVGANKSAEAGNEAVIKFEPVDTTNTRTTVDENGDGALVFDKAGRYFFNIVEVGTDGKGITHDKNVYRITVTVVDNDGQLKASYEIVNSAANNIVFKNKYTITPAVTSISGTKIMEGKPLVANEFMFELYETTDNFDTTNVSPVTVSNAADGKFVFDNIKIATPGRYYFVVKEIKGLLSSVSYDGMEYHVTITATDNGDGTLNIGTPQIVAPVGKTAIVFTNTYTPNAACTEIIAKKTLTGKKLVESEYNFVLTPTDANYQALAGGTALYTKNGLTYDHAQNNYVNANNPEYVEFHVSYEKGGTYYYTLSEVKGTLGGVTYDETVYHMKVVVTDSYMGVLTPVVYYYDTDGMPADDVVFSNVYKVTGSQGITLSGRKYLETEYPTDRELVAEEFEFELYQTENDFATDEKATLIQTLKNNEIGNYTAELLYDGSQLDKVGEEQVVTKFYYVLKEVKETEYNGIIYDSEEYKITITLTPDGKGNFAAAVEITNKNGDKVESNKLDFYNKYTTQKANATISGHKVLIGRDLAEGEFTFELYKADQDFYKEGKAAADVVNAVDGKFTFDAIEIASPGTHYFVVKEAKGLLSAVVYDATEYHVTVTATDNGDGTLSVGTPQIVAPIDKTAIIFTNTYTPNAACAEIIANKTLLGKNLMEGEYSFVLIPTDANYQALIDGTSLYTKNGFTYDHAQKDYVSVNNPAHVEFHVPYEKKGTYYYTINEVKETLDYVTYDETVYRIKVVVTDDNKGALTSVISYYDADGTPIDNVTFRNIYTVTGSDYVTLSGTKHLETENASGGSNRYLVPGEFKFDLYKAGSDFVIGEKLDTLRNDENGNYAVYLLYDANQLHKVGDEQVVTNFYYVLKEAKETEYNGIAYDNEEYRITVTLTPDGNGSFETSAIATTKNGVQAMISELDFYNHYTTTKASTTISGNKVLTGRELVKGEFAFELYKADQNFNKVGKAIDTASNEANGKFQFKDITFDKVGTYYFVVQESKQNPLNYITYDNTEYFITAVVRDDGEGKLTVNVTKTEKGNGAVNEIVFENAYVPVAMTGDNNNVVLWVTMLVLSTAVFVGLNVMRRKKNSKNFS